MKPRLLDLFAGPGGWDHAAKSLGMDPLGIESDDAACATREAAGLRTHQGDVAALDPLDFGPVEGLIASPPCQAWSMAGKRGGERDQSEVYCAIDDLAKGRDSRDWRRKRCEDARSLLVVEPYRWALALRPRWIALEQVPPVIYLWQSVADRLRSLGYHAWTGILSAERYGVPQTRKRAILLASLDGPVVPPEPTHQAYRPGEAAQEQHTLEETLEPWVSMAAALGWGMSERPGMTFAPGTGNGGVSYEGGSGARRGLRRERARGAWLTPCADPLGLKGDNWPERLPATVIAGDSRVFQPGGHHGEGEQSEAAINLTHAEAATLQGFPPDYPFAGTRSQRFQQIGNAVPPPLAQAILTAFIHNRERDAA